MLLVGTSAKKIPGTLALIMVPGTIYTGELLKATQMWLRLAVKYDY